MQKILGEKSIFMREIKLIIKEHDQVVYSKNARIVQN